MSLHLNSSNRIEILQGQLAQLLVACPLANPFAPEVVLVQNMAMQRWLNLQLAAAHGVAANIDYPLPAAWIWQFGQAVVAPGQALRVDPLFRDHAAWRIYALLPGMLEQAAFFPLQHYLCDDTSGIKRWQLSQRIADVFDRYQYYRPQWIRAWSAGRSTEQEVAPQWQPLLWRELIRDDDSLHRVAMVDALLARLRQGSLPAGLLPQRISGFALSSLPPLFVQVLCELAQHTEVHLFQHSPTDVYWADLRSARAIERLRLERPREVDYYDIGNDLLTSWGRQGQAFQDLLLSSDMLDSVEHEIFADAGEDTLLHRIQQDMLTLHDEGATVSADDSLRVAVCHSALRECQVLHDQILHWISADPTLKPEDILVMVPEISRYAPFVESVFRADDSHSRPFIPWNLSDIAVADEHPLVRMFLELLALPSWRFTFSQISAVLDVPELLENFGIDQSMKEEIIQLLHDSGVRWGLDASHRQTLDLPGTEQNTWRHGLDRLLAGYALGDVPMWNGIAPLAGASGGRGVALGRFCQILERLDWWRQQLQRSRPASQWLESLNVLLNEMFGSSRDEDDRLQQIRDVIGELDSVAGEAEISLVLLRRWLTDNLGTRTVSNRFFSGGVTFCGMRPMRSVPFRVICVLGMNDLAFPRREDSVSFDAMASQWRAGDPRKGDEDRYLLLETVLCARERLYFSYTGRSLKDNSPCQPSILLQELLDFIDARYRVEGDIEPLSARLVQVATMQAFNWRNFVSGEGQPGSFDTIWCRVAQSLLAVEEAEQRKQAAPWLKTVVPVLAESNDDGSLALERLAGFLKHPVKAFFTQRLRLRLPEDNSSDDEEIFSLDGLQSWQIRNDMLQSFVATQDAESEVHAGILERASASGILPHGAMAGLSYEEQQRNARNLLERLQGAGAEHRESRWVELSLPQDTETPPFSVRLSGQIRHYLPGAGLLEFTASNFKGKHLLHFWINHLALCASGEITEGMSSSLYCRDETVTLAFVPAIRAMQQLQHYVALYREGLTRPLPVFPEASFELVRYGAEPTASAWKKAGAKLNSDSYTKFPGDKDDAYIHLVLLHCEGDVLQDPEVLSLAQEFYGLALESRIKEA